MAKAELKIQFAKLVNETFNISECTKILLKQDILSKQDKILFGRDKILFERDKILFEHDEIRSCLNRMRKSCLNGLKRSC